MTDYEVVITAIAQKEILAIGQYINDQFKRPDTARKTMVNIAKGANKLRFSADSFPFVKNRFALTGVVYDYQYFMPYQRYFGIFYVDSGKNKVYVTHVFAKGKNFGSLLSDD